MFRKSPKKGIILFVLIVFIICSLFYPFSVAKASFLSDLIGLIGGGLGSVGRNVLAPLVSPFAAIGAWLTTKIAEGVVAFGAWFVSWTAGNPFDLNVLSYTNPAKNEFIKIGWTLLRDFTNLLFVLGLAYIGLATALERRTFQVTKTFPKLIIVALLINFTPLLCGIFVDLANIVSGFFLKNVDYSAFKTIFATVQSEVMDHILDIAVSGATIFKTVFLVVFGFVAGFVLIILGLIFLVRYFAIWLLVILSPFTFFALIFDETKHFFDLWWKQFYRWTFIVVPMSFFIYISRFMLANSGNFTSYVGDPTEGIFEAVGPYLYALIFLVGGMFLSFQMTAAGTGAIAGVFKKGLSAGRKGGMKAVGYGAKKLGTGASLAGRGAAHGFAEGFKEKPGGRGLGLGVIGAIKGAGKSTFTSQGREETRGRTAKRLERMHLRKAGSYNQQKEREVSSAQERLTSMDNKSLKDIASGKGGGHKGIVDRIAASKILAGKGDFSLGAGGGVDMNKETRLIEEAKKTGVNLSELTQARPDLAPIVNSEQMTSLINEKMHKGVGQDQARKEAKRHLIKKEIEKMSAAQFRNKVQKEAISNTDVFLSMNSKQIKGLASGSVEQKNIIRGHAKPYSDAQLQFRRSLASAHKQGDHVELSRLRNMRDAVLTNPNFS